MDQQMDVFVYCCCCLSLSGEMVALFSEEKLVRGTIHEYAVEQGW